MATTATGIATNVTQSSSPTATVPSDGDGLAVASVNGALGRLLDYIANIFTGPLRLAVQATAIQPSTIVTALTPIAGWTALNGLGYWKDAVGIVHIRGGASWATGASTSAIFTLPVGFRVATTGTGSRFFPCAMGSGVLTIAQVVSDGSVSLYASATQPTLNGTLVDFGTISYLAEQ